MTMKAMLVILSFAAAVKASARSAVAAASEQDPTSVNQQEDAQRARALLARAVARLAEQGEPSLAAFSRAGEFTDGDLYVYVLGIDGVMQASGGSSSTFIGRNMLDYVDADGRKPFVEMVKGARTQGKGRVEYRWLNHRRGLIEPKVAYYQAAGARIVAVGYYAPRGTVEQAMAMLWRAVDLVKRRGPEAFPELSDLGRGFVRDDTYVFVVGIKDKRMLAHGAMPRLEGTDVAELRDVNGVPIIQKMLEIVRTKGEGTLDYDWPNPVTRKAEHKRTFLRRVGDYLVGVGYYTPIESSAQK